MNLLVLADPFMEIQLDAVDLFTTILEQQRRFLALLEQVRDHLTVFHTSRIILQHIVKVIDVSSQFSDRICCLVIKPEA